LGLALHLPATPYFNTAKSVFLASWKTFFVNVKDMPLVLRADVEAFNLFQRHCGKSFSITFWTEKTHNCSPTKSKSITAYLT